MPVYRLPATEYIFPDPAEAEPDGLLAVDGDLSPERLIQAYAAGIFPWYSVGSPILWWSPDPRCLLFPNELHIPKSLPKSLRKNNFSITMDTVFAEVITACSKRPKLKSNPNSPTEEDTSENTWLVPEMITAYTNLHKLGIAHSVEVWQNGQLAGGLYGVSLGKAFFGESMFYRVPDASKAALLFLADLLKSEDFSFIDCQQETPNLLRFGARTVPRKDFLTLLDKALQAKTLCGKWDAEGIYFCSHQA